MPLNLPVLVSEEASIRSPRKLTFETFHQWHNHYLTKVIELDSLARLKLEMDSVAPIYFMNGRFKEVVRDNGIVGGISVL